MTPESMNAKASWFIVAALVALVVVQQIRVNRLMRNEASAANQLVKCQIENSQLKARLNGK